MVRWAALLALCACISTPRGRCAQDADCAGGAPGLFCAEGVCQSPPRVELDAVDATLRARSGTVRVSGRVSRSHGAPSARALLGSGEMALPLDAGGAFAAEVPLALAPAGVEGPVPLVVEARDDLGHTTRVAGQVNVDDAPPRVQIAPPPSTPVVRGTQVVLTVHVQDLSGAVVNGGVKQGDGYQFIVDTAQAPPDAASDSVTVTATDAFGHVGAASVAIPITRLRWRTREPAAAVVALSSIVVANDLVVGATSRELWMLRRADGSEKALVTTGTIIGLPAASDGGVFISRADDSVCRFNYDGSQAWCCGAIPILSAGPILSGDWAIVATSGSGQQGSRIHAFADCTINVSHTVVLADFAGTQPAFAPAGPIYAGAAQAVVSAHFDNPGLAGNPTQTPARYFGQPTPRANDVLFTSTTSTLDAFTFSGDVANPPAVTQVVPYGTSTTPPTIAADGTLTLTTSDRRLIALHPDASPKWSITLPGRASASPAHGADGTLYVGTDSGAVLALSPADGSVLWSYDAGAAVQGPLAPACDQTLYVAVSDGVLALAIDVPGLADSPWPRPGHDVRNSGDARRPLRQNNACAE